MGEAKEIRITEYEINGYPRDLLQRFTAELGIIKKSEEEEDEEEELNLGLSLGSLFGINKRSSSEKNRLVRSSSIAGLTSLFREEDVSLIRTCSLPVEAEEDRRKRKEMQSLRRLEAKRKRSEKQRNHNNNNNNNCRIKEKAVPPSSLDEEEEEDHKPVVVVTEGIILNKGGLKQHQQQQYMVSNGFSPFRPPPNWASPSSQLTTIDSASPKINPRSHSSQLTTTDSASPKINPGSQGSSSSGTSEIEGRPAHHQGSSSCTEARSPKSVQSLPEQNEQKPIVAPTATTPNAEKSSMSTGVEVENPSNKPKVNDNGSREMGMKMMEEEKMPCCWTTGSGPNGKRIEGLLYNYRKGEEVRIVCVCHGSFLTPAEFVKHAGGGGGDVENPLRHITVNLSSSSF